MSNTGETAGGTLGSGVITAWLWVVLRSRYPNLPEMPATVSPAVGGALWMVLSNAWGMVS